MVEYDAMWWYKVHIVTLVISQIWYGCKQFDKKASLTTRLLSTRYSSSTLQEQTLQPSPSVMSVLPTGYFTLSYQQSENRMTIFAIYRSTKSKNMLNRICLMENRLGRNTSSFSHIQLQELLRFFNEVILKTMFPLIY